MALGTTMALGNLGNPIEETKPGGSKTFRFVDGPSAVAQRITNRLRTREGESTYHPDMGLPRDLIVGGFHPGLLEAAVASEVRKEPAVDTVDDVTAFFNTGNRIDRIVNISVSATLVSGESLDVSTALRG